VKLLLDVHIQKATVPALQRRCPTADIAHISEWKGGLFRTADDADILLACFSDNRVLVTYDQRTIPGLLRRWAAEERHHAGVIFGDSNSVPANDPGAVAAALSVLMQSMSGSDTTNVVRYLRRLEDSG
jgi:hypothetical protein